MPSAKQKSLQLACMEVWGGNPQVDSEFELPGLSGWIHSAPLGPGTGGGDVYYLSVCDKGLLSRIVLADVEGHGQAVSSVAETFHELVRKYINVWDQSDFARELNRSFPRGSACVNFATMLVLGFYTARGQLLVTNAGHYPPLWYRAREGRWEWMSDRGPRSLSAIADIPLGLISGTEYRQSGFQLEDGDLLVLYTDGITESRNPSDDELGYEGLMRAASGVPVTSPAETGQALLEAVEAFEGGRPANDDRTLLVLKSPCNRTRN